MASRKLQVAAAGVGRMGHRHALNFLNRNTHAELAATFTPDPRGPEQGHKHLAPYIVAVYDDYIKMISHKDLDAVGTATSVHAEEAIKAMHKNLHVLFEQPLSTGVDVVRRRLESCVLSCG